MKENMVLFILLLSSSYSLVYSLKCYISLVPTILNYSVTSDTLPSFDNNKLIDVSGECTLTIIWLRNPSNTEIIFGYNSITNKNNFLIDSLLANVQYQLEGDELTKRLSRDIQYKCQSSNECNNGTVLKRILNSIHLEEHFSDTFDSLIESDESFSNQSINQCYFNRNSTHECLPIDYLNCRRCQISMNIFPLLTNDICATCPTITSEFNSIERDAIFIINNRSQIIDRIQLTCQIGKHCNSIENVYQIRLLSFIQFDFDKFFLLSSSTHIHFSILLQIFLFFIRFILIK
ncbi:unnamed protein product [Adineta steineri]|uniref:Uncharacterized protein n=1 Tax=Adineta steineri TaxID=433720 RepID=A0A819SE99_9BILA|nr:unnamed protein product [Adineta steineri]CAF4058335.1 unnamed protein product [Adineta steineri]